MYTIQVKSGADFRAGLKEYLGDKGVMTKVYFGPVHLTRFYRKVFGFKGGELPMTEKLSQRVLTLPMYASLTKREMDFVVDTIKGFVENLG